MSNGLAAAFDSILIDAVYTFGVKPVGSTVALIILSSPAKVMLPVGLTLSQVPPVTDTVAPVAAPVLDRTKLLVSATFPEMGSPVM